MANYDQAKLGSDFRVGLITFAAVVCLILGITFSGGDKGLFLQKSSTVKAHLADVGGLKKGSSVTMNGMTVGRVTQITFVSSESRTELNQNRNVEVVMEIRQDVRDRIKIDSIPAVRTQGMLGDRYIDIPSNSDTPDVLPEGKILMGASAGDFDKALNETVRVLAETEKLLSSINKQQGTIGQLVHDQEFYNHLLEITSEMNELLKDFKKNPRRYIKFSMI